MLLRLCKSLRSIIHSSCDPLVTSNTRLEININAENPFGHLPATQYQSYPFYSWMSLIYVVTLIIWGLLCIQYSKEIMSVNIMIVVLFFISSIDYIVCYYIIVF